MSIANLEYYRARSVRRSGLAACAIPVFVGAVAIAAGATQLQPTTNAALQQAMSDLKTRIAEKDFKGARVAAERVLAIDPNITYARGVLSSVEEMAARTQAIRDRDFAERRAIHDRIDKLPLTEVERAQQHLLAKLEQKVPEVRFDNVGFADVLEFLKDASGIIIKVNWAALEAAGIDRRTPVWARLRDVRLSKALETILRDVGGGKNPAVPLGYETEQGILAISTYRDLYSRMPTMTYEVGDLLNISPRREEIAEQFVTLIKDTVNQESWSRAEHPATIRHEGNQLIVTQTRANHRQLTRLLEQLRATRDPREPTAGANEQPPTTSESAVLRRGPTTMPGNIATQLAAPAR